MKRREWVFTDCICLPITISVWMSSWWVRSFEVWSGKNHLLGGNFGSYFKAQIMARLLLDAIFCKLCCLIMSGSGNWLGITQCVWSWFEKQQCWRTSLTTIRNSKILTKYSEHVDYLLCQMFISSFHWLLIWTISMHSFRLRMILTLGNDDIKQ